MPVSNKLFLPTTRLFWRCLALAALLLTGAVLVGGCPQRTDEGSPVRTGSGPAPEAGKGGLKGGLSPGITPPAEPGAADSGDSAAGAAGESDAMDSQRAAAPPSAAELAGRWFALYGREGSGMAYYTYMDAKLITLNAQGELLIEDGEAGPNAALRGRYELAGGRMRVCFADPRLGAEQLLGGPAPGQAQAPQAPQSSLILAGNRAMSPDEMGLQQEGDGQYLVLSNGRDRLTVYGRDDSAQQAGSSGLPGQWLLYLGPRGNYTCEVSVDGPNIKLVWREGGGWFEGRFSHGYFIGHGQDAATGFAGALTLSEPGILNGYYSPRPYSDAMPLFDLKRIAAQ